ncbi:MAG: TIM barrel protein [Candidatus Latescibacteria bacterium]|nr:TIM barrel protein [Candidatus Latescibacterota bacterium]
MRDVDRLLIGTAGTPNSAKPRDTVAAIKRLKELDLDIMELEYVRGTFPGEEKAREIAKTAKEYGIRLTAHGPYYINLNADDPDKREASRKRVLNTAYFGGLSGAESITFHAGFFLGQPPESVFITIKNELSNLLKTINSFENKVDISPELTGKPTQFGSLEEILAISKEVEGIHPCIDWAHLYARTGVYNSASEFQSVLDSIRQTLGDSELKRMHMHVSGIEYGDKGEKKHLSIKESDFNFQDLLKVLKDYEVCGFLICESPSLEDDALLLKKYYETL